MRIKLHKFKSATALCAVALFSLTTAGFAAPRPSFDGILDQGKQPASVSDGRPVQPADEGSAVSSGTYTGTVSVD